MATMILTHKCGHTSSQEIDDNSNIPLAKRYQYRADRALQSNCQDCQQKEKQQHDQRNVHFIDAFSSVFNSQKHVSNKKPIIAARDHNVISFTSGIYRHNYPVGQNTFSLNKDSKCRCFSINMTCYVLFANVQTDTLPDYRYVYDWKPTESFQVGVEKIGHYMRQELDKIYLNAKQVQQYQDLYLAECTRRTMAFEKLSAIAQGHGEPLTKEEANDIIAEIDSLQQGND